MRCRSPSVQVTCIEHSEAVMLSYSAFVLVKVADEIRNGEGEIEHSKPLLEPFSDLDSLTAIHFSLAV